MRDEMETINGKADAARKNKAKAIENLQEVEMSVVQAKDALASATADGDSNAAKNAQKWLNTAEAEVKEVTRAVASFRQAEAALNVAKQVLVAAAGQIYTYRLFLLPSFSLLSASFLFVSAAFSLPEWMAVSPGAPVLKLSSP